MKNYYKFDIFNNNTEQCFSKCSVKPPFGTFLNFSYQKKVIELSHNINDLS